MPDFPCNTTRPTFDDSIYIAPTATVIGAVTMGKNASIWYGASVRADIAPIIIGAESNVQDNATLHVDFDLPVIIGERVTIGHNAVVHGATLEDEVLVGMGAVVLNRAVVGKGSIIAAGAVVREGMIVPPGSLVAGVPGKIVKEVSEEHQVHIRENAAIYVTCAQVHMRSSGS